MVFYLKPAIILIFISAYLLYAFYRIKKNKLSTDQKVKEVFNIIFFVYLVKLLGYTVFPIYIMPNPYSEEYTLLEIIKMNTNIIPFINMDVKDFVLNIIMTFPLDCILPCLLKNLSDKKIILIALLTGIGFELNQFIFILLQGFTFRNININDSIANFLGVYLGFKTFELLFKMLYKVFKKNISKKPDSKFLLFLN